MAAVDRVFGLILVLAGLAIAAYYTVWQLLSLPVLSRKNSIYNYFMEPYYLFKLPAAALVVGLILIDQFISRTNKKIAAEKARKAAIEAQKKRQ
mmetsp:Transcript_9746/g.16415  ORF Transcript_9746/g.16415 Transcript_9746/m.16415 type:complete len:94 (+) Transcript_9746:39-320(+)|eukprot:CAMPEP_0168608424 /NCGR_PEP_ID=MMETSP0449_2-20121227/619_1 /TAXON_ID=1082188 /ORGANISM="Strombidium rassoulzadegani, Strain ras09" /LENGTH=93 /DNA_ID=CAMNT_0008648407 /DNA_START=14 /DNA_END=295 /DNA_ORIENTATION=+